VKKEKVKIQRIGMRGKKVLKRRKEIKSLKKTKKNININLKNVVKIMKIQLSKLTLKEI
jgi:hypothetical protein